MLSLGLNLVIFLMVSGFFRESGVMQDWVCHELLLDKLHSTHDWRGVALLYNIDVIVAEIDFLLSSLFTEKDLRITLLIGITLANLILIHNTDCSIWFTTEEHWILLSFDSLNDFLGLGSHFI
jgi:hypothetical protein